MGMSQRFQTTAVGAMHARSHRAPQWHPTPHTPHANQSSTCDLPEVRGEAGQPHIVPVEVGAHGVVEVRHAVLHAVGGGGVVWCGVVWCGVVWEQGRGVFACQVVSVHVHSGGMEGGAREELTPPAKLLPPPTPQKRPKPLCCFT